MHEYEVSFHILSPWLIPLKGMLFVKADITNFLKLVKFIANIYAMKIGHIRSMDLNLLVIAAALFAHKNVSKAAVELGMTQSAVSHALARLRVFFKDPLFVRTSKGIVPTEFAKSLEKELIEWLNRGYQLVTHKKKFDPASVKARIVLATTDYFEVTVMSRLQPILAKEAPGLQISIRPTGGELPKKKLEVGSVDLAIAGFYSDVPEGFYQTKLFDDSFGVAVRKNHSFIQKKLTMENYLKSEHALITLQGDFKDRLSSKLKKPRNIIYGTYSFTALPWLLQQTDLVLTAPKRLLEKYSEYFPIQQFDCPVDLGSFTFRMVWQAQTHENPLHQWFRKKLKELM